MEQSEVKTEEKEVFIERENRRWNDGRSRSRRGSLFRTTKLESLTSRTQAYRLLRNVDDLITQ